MTDARKRLRRAADLLNSAIEYLAAGILIFTVGINFTQIVLRYGFNSGLPWSEEAMRYAMIWMAMLAGAAVVYRQEHVISSLIPGSAPEAVQLASRFVCVATTAAFATLLVIHGTKAALANTVQFSPAMRMPLALAYVAMPIGGLVMLVNVVALLGLGLPRPEHDELAAGEMA
jgi:TRAP-type C4-dicarboxylate transport system permease small subunit